MYKQSASKMAGGQKKTITEEMSKRMMSNNTTGPKNRHVNDVHL